MQSLRGEERRAFLANHPDPPVLSYSLVAASEFSNTSPVLRATWLLLSAGKEDGMLVAADGTRHFFLGRLPRDRAGREPDLSESDS